MRGGVGVCVKECENLEPVLIFTLGSERLRWAGAVGHACGATNLDGGPIFASAALALAIKPKPKQVLRVASGEWRVTSGQRRGDRVYEGADRRALRLGGPPRAAF